TSSSSVDDHSCWNWFDLPKSVSLSMLRVSVITRRFRSSSGAIVLKIVASRSLAPPSSASAVASSCATFTSSNAAVTAPTTGPAWLSARLARPRLTPRGRGCRARCATWRAPSGWGAGTKRGGDGVEVAECGEDGRGLRRDHRGAVGGTLRRSRGGREIADIRGTAGDREQPLLRRFVEDAAAAGRDRQHDRAPQIVAP